MTVGLSLCAQGEVYVQPSRCFVRERLRIAGGVGAGKSEEELKRVGQSLEQSLTDEETKP